ncbi:hypothetical protein ABW19_dt0205681 [Dactylella cylindrospora]|nr:hypothetical protein ABW19_dt0205681 [Dactylella cylindrospora]
MGLILLSLATGVQASESLPIALIVLSLGVNWLIMFWYGYQLQRKKSWLYPVLFLINPLLNWFYLVASVYTFRRRSWGGPRVKKAGESVETEEEDEPSDDRPERTASERDKERENKLPWRTLSGRFAPARVNEDGLYHRSELELPMSGRSSVALPQPAPSEGAYTADPNIDRGRTDYLIPPAPNHLNRNSVLTHTSYDSEVGRLYAPAQNFLHADSDQGDEERHGYVAEHLVDYGVPVPVPVDSLTISPLAGGIHSIAEYHGDIGEMNLAEVQQDVLDTLPHAISDDTPARYRASFQNSIDLLYPEDSLEGDRNSDSPDSWLENDEAAFTTSGISTGNEMAPLDGGGSANPFVTPPTNNSTPVRGETAGPSMANTKKGRCLRKKPAPMEVDDGQEKVKKGGLFGIFKKH